MQLDRIALADIHAPGCLARAVHAQIGVAKSPDAIPGPVPVVEIARALDIGEVRIDRFDGFAGMLLTDRVRNRGVILANNRHGDRRARFTVAHELAHFLLERHEPTDPNGFACKSSDMRETRHGRRERRQESEANRFAIELLVPPGLVVKHLSQDPDLRDAQRMRDALEVSLEASIRRMIERRDEPLAGIWSHKGHVRYLVRNDRFPFVTLDRGNRLPQATKAFRAVTNGRHGFTGFVESPAMAWTGRAGREILEQTRVGRDGHAVTLLWADQPDDDEDDSGIPELTMPKFR